MTFREIEKIILADGWQFKKANGKITIPYHSGDLDPRTIKSILKQAGLL